MNFKNTTLQEDRTISIAVDIANSLEKIIERLDGIIEAWKDASGCETPEGLEEKFRFLMMGADE